MDLSVEALNTAARAAALAGRPAEAMALFERSLEVDPAQAPVMKELAAAAARAGARHDALRICRACLRRTEGALAVQLRFIYVLHSLGAEAEAVGEAVALAGRCDDPAACVRSLDNLVREVDPAAPESLAALRLLIRHGAATSAHSTTFAKVLEHQSTFRALAADPSDHALLASPLLTDADVLAGLTLMVVADYPLEKVLTHLRSAFLRHIGGDGALAPGFARLRPALMALAQQCFINEYVWAETAADRAGCVRLAAIIEDARQQNRDLTLVRDAAAVLACFQPLRALPAAGALLIASPGVADAGWAALLRQQIEEPLYERALQARIGTVGAITDAVSQAVRDQYQENPYPRWIVPNRVVATALPQRPGRDAIVHGAGADILVAGCGTGHQSVQVARLYPRARVLAVDLSRASLAYALRKTEELGITSIAYAQADILNLGVLAKRFDGIECGGVLHHMHDPAAGLAVLAGLLKPDGVMRLALYSQTGRRVTIAGRRLRMQEGMETSLAGIRQFRELLFALPPGHPVAYPALGPEIYSASEIRDLLFHVQEDYYDIAGLAALLASCGLVFGGFDSLPRRVQFDYLAAFPDDPAMVSLANWDAFERRHPNTFISMYQFWAHKPHA